MNTGKNKRITRKAKMLLKIYLLEKKGNLLSLD